ncbi:MAG: response regulator [Geminicoccaceae bacterium]|nr:response regulator [Geminicoccaceae bacterium]
MSHLSLPAFPVTRACQILIVGDPALSCGLMRTVLSRLDYGVTCALGAIEAARCLGEGRFDLALIALRLPDGGGVDLLGQIRRRRGLHRNLPVIMFGDAWDQEAVRRDCRRAGAQAYLEKPISISRLLASIRGLVTLSPGRAGLPRLGDIMQAPVDLARLLDMSDGDIQLEREILALYLTTAARYLREMRGALDDDDDAWEGAAHALKGASRNVGAVVVGDLADEAEHAAPSSEMVRKIEAALRASHEYLARRHPETLAATVLKLS